MQKMFLHEFVSGKFQIPVLLFLRLCNLHSNDLKYKKKVFVQT